MPSLANKVEKVDEMWYDLSLFEGFTAGHAKYMRNALGEVRVVIFSLKRKDGSAFPAMSVNFAEIPLGFRPLDYSSENTGSFTSNTGGVQNVVTRLNITGVTYGESAGILRVISSATNAACMAFHAELTFKTQLTVLH